MIGFIRRVFGRREESIDLPPETREAIKRLAREMVDEEFENAQPHLPIAAQAHGCTFHVDGYRIKFPANLALPPPFVVERMIRVMAEATELGVQVSPPPPEIAPVIDRIDEQVKAQYSPAVRLYGTTDQAGQCGPGHLCFACTPAKNARN